MRGRRDDRPAPAEGFRDDVDALASRIDMLAAVVRETSGAVVAVQGEVAQAERRLDGRLEKDVTDLGRALTRVQDEIAQLRARSERRAPSTAPDAELAHEVTVLADRVRTLSAMVSENASRIAARDGSFASLRDTVTQEGQRVDVALEALRGELSELAARMADAARRSAATGAPDARLDGRVTALADRLDGLAGSLRETTGGLAAAHVKIAGVDGRIDELAAALEAHSSETRAATTALERGVAALSERLASDPASREQVARLEGSVVALGEHVDAVSALVRSGAGDIAREEEAEALNERLDALAAHVDGLAAEIRERATEDARPSEASHGLTEDALTVQLEPLSAEIARLADRVDETAAEAKRVEHDVNQALAGRMDELERGQSTLRLELSSSVSALADEQQSLAEEIERVATVAQEALSRPTADPAPALRELAAKLEQIDEDRRSVARQLADAESAWADERETLRVQLERLTMTASETGSPAGEDAERIVSELTSRLERLERERESVAELASLADGWTNSLATLAARVDYGLIKLQQATAAPSGTADAKELVELAGRVAAMESDRDSVLGELNRATESWAIERAALHERVAELSARIVTGPLDAPTLASVDLGDASAELDRLRIGLEGIRMRLAYHEKTVAEIGSKSIVDRLDELSERLDRLQFAVAASAATGPLDGSGSSMLGLDVGELLRRIEQAERSAANQRKDMLGHLERVAARMDWRLHRLEQHDGTKVV